VPPSTTHDALRRTAGAVWTLVRTDFKARYHGTVMGFLWALLKPLVVVITLISVFRFIFQNTPHYAIHLIIGISIYEYFQEGTKTGLIALAHKAHLLTKSRFPRWILVVTSTVNALITLGVFSAGIVLYLLIDPAPDRPRPDLLRLLLFAAYLAQLVLIVVGLSLGSCALFVRYRDLNQVWEVVTHAGFFAAPVIYSLDILPEQYHKYLYLWPPTAFIQFSRAVLMGKDLPTPFAHLLMAGMTATVLVVGIALYRRLVGGVVEHL
jgi:ABC-type polysaccharide/polyol phosphate export permease